MGKDRNIPLIVILEEIKDLDIPDSLKTWDKKVRALLYFRHIRPNRTEALKFAEIPIYNASKQLTSIQSKHKIVIFCDKFNDTPIADSGVDPHSRKGLIKSLDNTADADKIRSLVEIAKLKGYYDTKQGSLDTTKPIYIITGSRHVHHKKLTSKQSTRLPVDSTEEQQGE